MSCVCVECVYGVSRGSNVEMVECGRVDWLIGMRERETRSWIDAHFMKIRPRCSACWDSKTAFLKKNLGTRNSSIG